MLVGASKHNVNTLCASKHNVNMTAVRVYKSSENTVIKILTF